MTKLLYHNSQLVKSFEVEPPVKPRYPSANAEAASQGRAWDRYEKEVKEYNNALQHYLDTACLIEDQERVEKLIFDGNLWIMKEGDSYSIDCDFEKVLQWHPVGSDGKWKNTNEYYFMDCQRNGVPTRIVARIVEKKSKRVLIVGNESAQAALGLARIATEIISEPVVSDHPENEETFTKAPTEVETYKGTLHIGGDALGWQKKIDKWIENEKKGIPPITGAEKNWRLRKAGVVGKKIEGLSNDKFNVHEVDSQNVEFEPVSNSTQEELNKTLWKSAMQHSGSLMDPIKWLSDNFTITRKSPKT